MKRLWRSTIVASATGTRDLSNCEGSAVPAAVVQRAVLAGLDDRIAVVVPNLNALLRTAPAAATA